MGFSLYPSSTDASQYLEMIHSSREFGRPLETFKSYLSKPGQQNLCFWDKCCPSPGDRGTGVIRNGIHDASMTFWTWTHLIRLLDIYRWQMKPVHCPTQPFLYSWAQFNMFHLTKCAGSAPSFCFVNVYLGLSILGNTLLVFAMCEMLC